MSQWIRANTPTSEWCDLLPIPLPRPSGENSIVQPLWTRALGTMENPTDLVESMNRGGVCWVLDKHNKKWLPRKDGTSVAPDMQLVNKAEQNASVFSTRSIGDVKGSEAFKVSSIRSGL